jgi:molybdenum cofactor cytidylyltransferase
MARRVVEVVCAAGLAQVIVVLGAHAPTVAETLAGLAVDLVVNEGWSQGLSSSVRVGLDVVRPEIEAALLVLADQPTLSPPLLDALLDHYQATRARIVAPFYEGRRGNPVLFDRTLFPELRAVTGDRGGREIITRHQADVARLDVDDPAVLLDVDTIQDYEKAQTSGAKR